jgi:hypothetical protein
VPAVASPAGVIVATFVFDEAQVANIVASLVVPSL